MCRDGRAARTTFALGRGPGLWWGGSSRYGGQVGDSESEHLSGGLTSAPVEVRVSCGEASEAERIAAALVAESLAACVHLAPIRSVYRWDGEVRHDDEVELSITTTAGCLDEVLDRIAAMHSYDLPAIWWTAIDGTRATVEWAVRSVRSSGTARNR